MRQWNVLATAMAIIVALAPPGLYAEESKDNHPNVIFIFTDDQGWGDVGAYGHPHLKTPHLDQLAREGLRLGQFYVNSPVCSPSRASLLTGKFAPTTGVHYAIGGPAGQKYNSVRWLDENLTTIYDVFKSAGYITGHYGKWHIGHKDIEGKPGAPPPAEYGVDESGTTHSTGPKLKGKGKRMTNANRSEIIADEGVAFIERNKDKPFFLSLWIMDPHSVLDPDQAAMEPYMKWTHPQVKDRYRSSLTVYYAIISNIDKAVGRVMEAIDEAGLKKRTIIIFSSDNGPSPLWSSETGHAGAGLAGPLRGVKGSLYEGGIRVPFIISWPGHVPANKLDDSSVVAASDMLPTLAKMAGIGLPKDLQIDGEDRAAVLEGKPSARRNPIFWEYRFGSWGRDIHRSPRLVMREGPWKLLMNPDDSRVELYNIVEDPTETSNLAKVDTARVKQMKELLMTWWKDQVPDRDKAPAWSGQSSWRVPPSGGL